MKKIKKIHRIIPLTIAMGILLSGCNVLEMIGLTEANNYIPVEKKTVEVGHYKETKLDYGYNSLQSDAQKTLYSSIEKAVWNISDTVGENGLYAVGDVFLEDVKMTKKDIIVTIEAFSCDNPELFWLSYSFGYNIQGDSTYVYLYSQYNSETVLDMQKKLNKSVDDFFSDIPAELSEYEREVFIHDKLDRKSVV